MSAFGKGELFGCVRGNQPADFTASALIALHLYVHWADR
jgi:hypothetical protein